MPCFLLFGGSGYIGTKLAEKLLDGGNTVYIADIKESPLKDREGVVFKIVDVRKPIPSSTINHPVDWIFNFAAVHREPGHEAHEYYDTNLKGAENVCAFAEKAGISNIFFTSSISTYGPTLTATDEYKTPTPNTPYGITKLQAESIHKSWLEKNSNRKLIICRPGVIYGPGDPGNILRMIRAVKKGYFLLPVSPTIKKSYGYVYGLLDSIDFAMKLPDNLFMYNYVEKETEPLGELIRLINTTLGFNGKLIRFPMWILKLAASIIHKINPNINGIHPERVKKVARPTHIVPKVLIEQGFEFKYDFASSLKHWKSISSSDF
jgi:nucleoside-diphosphate-sugar epimerase